MKEIMNFKSNKKILNLVFLSAFVVSCSKKIEVQVPGLTESSGQEIGADGLLASGVGVLDFFAINRKFSSLTMVAHTKGNVRQSYNTLKGSLPQTSHPSGVSGNAILSLAKHAALYCDEAFNQPTANQLNGTPVRQLILPGFDFTRNPTQAFTAQTKPQIAAALMDHFWGTGLTRAEGSEATILELFDTLTANIPQNENDSGTTGNVLVGLCTTLLISFNNISL